MNLLHLAALGTLVAAGPPTNALAADPAAQSVADLSLEELMNVEVYSANKKTQRLTETAAPVFVISRDDIHRSGATSVPELLRLVPGVDVAWVGGGAYSVTIRGFSGRFANKLLVLQDGRSLYTSLYAGVFWERELPLMADIERIEVIRGPGAAIYGANAVNGVINIITTNANNSAGGLVGGGVGNQDQRSGFARYGFNIDEVSSIKFYGRGDSSDLGQAKDADFPLSDDTTRTYAAGMRYDRDADGSKLSIQGEFHKVSNDLQVIGPSPLTLDPISVSGGENADGGYFTAQYEKTLAVGNTLNTQLNYSHDITEFTSLFHERRDVIHAEAQDHLQLGAHNDLMLGISAQTDNDDITGSDYVQVNSTTVDREVYNFLVQDEIGFFHDRAHVTLGANVENDTFIGTHFLPDLRLLFNTSEHSELWLAASRAMRSPSRAERDISYVLGPTIAAQPPYVPLPIIPSGTGTAGFNPEYETAYQVGFRDQISENLSADISLFDSHYSALRSGCPDTASPSLEMLGSIPYLQLPVLICNGTGANSHGVEVNVNWHATDWWRFIGTLSTVDIHTYTYSSDISTEYEQSNSPKVQATLRSDIDMGPTTLYLAARYVDALTVSTMHVENVPAYVALDARWAWRVSPRAELALRGTNLNNAHQVEYFSNGIVTPPLDATRTVYASAELTF